LVRDGRLRTLWRALLFILGVLAILELGLLLLLPVMGPVSMEGDRLSTGLIVQSALLLAAAVLAGRGMLRWVDRRPAASLGFPLDRRAPLEVLAGLIVGAGIVAVVAGILALAGAYRYVAEAGSLIGWLSVAGISLAAFAIPAAAEEALFRGYLFRTLVEGAGMASAVVVTSVLFTLVHGANPNVTVFGLLNIMLAGVLLALAVLRTGTLWFATALHLGWNWVMAGPLDLPVSGIGGYDVPLYDMAETGPAWLTGGNFGPEGGLAGTAAALLGILLVVRLTRPGATLAGHYVNGRHDHVEDR